MLSSAGSVVIEASPKVLLDFVVSAEQRQLTVALAKIELRWRIKALTTGLFEVSDRL